LNAGVMMNGVVAVVSLAISSTVTSTAIGVTKTLGASATGAAISINGAGGNVSSTATSFSSPMANFREIGVFRQSQGQGLFILDSNEDYQWQPSDTATLFGLPGDIPVAGDWTGSGVIRIGVFRCPAAVNVCQWYIDLNNNGVWDGVTAGGGLAGGDAVWNFGLPGDVPVVGDWTGDGISKIGVFRCPASGTCYWVLDAGNKHYYDPATARLATYGLPGDKPVVSNWSGGLVDQVGVFRGNGLWIVDNLGFGTWSPADATFSYGLTGDYPVVGNWYGVVESTTDPLRIGVFRPGTGQWILNRSGSNSWLPTDPVGNFGQPGDLPVVGFWTIP
jgi:hypothetical protein